MATLACLIVIAPRINALSRVPTGM
ncbi:hypothetical protein PM8797T_21068 [Gimesia maris DSM 8797]|nr:hypothetical protein PM8797T_21068 [Gimesia maris DSM 8797]